MIERVYEYSGDNLADLRSYHAFVQYSFDTQDPQKEVFAGHQFGVGAGNLDMYSFNGSVGVSVKRHRLENF